MESILNPSRKILKKIQKHTLAAQTKNIEKESKPAQKILEKVLFCMLEIIPKNEAKKIRKKAGCIQEQMLTKFGG